ncbi:DNA repair protein RecN [Bifidobacterium longum]|uniref:DNA repair protein RecN n=1 Tax=Bifidobacterium longum subsp. suis TaxID=1695 RepID=A0A087BFC5_BIFLN|nr:DNA repair protein RecN [Bifidobacterium longum]KFI69725.1 DNA repair protein RecN [Bifidobacterium longum subsp. suis]
MLEELDIRNLGPIREAAIAPAAGMTAITGETGAGKSMLLSAIRLVSGGAAESSRVSAGADEAWAQAIFALSDDAVVSEHSGDTNDAGDDAGSDDSDSGLTGAAAAVAKAHDAGVDPEDGELFLSRTVRASGRSRAVLGGKSVPRSVLGAIAGELVIIHGQTDQLKIAAAARQREFLDRVAGDEAELAAYRKAWDALAAMDERLERLRSQESSARQQADYLRESIDRINRTDPQPGEDEELKARRERIENAADIAQGVGSALGALDASQVDVDAADGASAVELINHAVTSLRAIRVGGTFAEQADRLESINADLGDVVFALSQELGDEGSVEDLDQINGRIHELGDLTRRCPTLADVLAWRDKAAFDLEDLDASPEKVAELESERQTLYDAALAAADVLSAARVAAAADLGARVTEELGSLAMLGASLEVRVTPRDKADDPLGPYGRDDIAFLFTPFEGSPQLPMGKSASGGELSRLMLALELVAADTRGGADQTFIFDEVDAGVGGKAAVELGKRLARLARSAQVIVVTHLAQVASWADAQFVVTKEPPDADDDDLGVVTTIAEVNGETRVHEIARMLSGSESEASLDHARELLKESVL